MIALGILDPGTIIALADGTIGTVPQHDTHATYSHLRIKTGGSSLLSRRIVPTNELVEIICLPHEAIADELTRWQDRTCGDGSHI